MQLFPVILEDNEAPFSDPVMTENARAENNPYRLIPRTKVFYCDPYVLGKKFKRHADKIILKQNGLTK